MTKTELMLLVTTNGSPLMALERVAAMRNIAPRTLQNALYAKTCPFPMFRDGSTWFAHVTDVAAWIDKEMDAARAAQEA